MTVAPTLVKVATTILDPGAIPQRTLGHHKTNQPEGGGAGQNKPSCQEDQPISETERPGP